MRSYSWGETGGTGDEIKMTAFEEKTQGSACLTVVRSRMSQNATLTRSKYAREGINTARRVLPVLLADHAFLM